MPIAEADVGDETNHEVVEVEERIPLADVIDENQEEMHEQQQEEGGDDRYEEATELPLDDRQEVNDNKVLDGKENGEEEKCLGGQGASQPVFAKDEEMFDETEKHQLEDGNPLAKEQDTNEKIKEDAVEGVHANVKLQEVGIGAVEDFEDQGERVEEAIEIQSKDVHPLASELEINDKNDGERSGKHLRETSEGAADHGETVVPMQHQSNSEHPVEKMHEESEDVAQNRLDTGEENRKQLERRGEQSEAVDDHVEAALQPVTKASLSELSEASDTPVPVGQFVDTKGVNAEPTPTDMNGAETSSVRPVMIEESAIKEELAVEEETAVIAESGKEHTEIQESDANGNADKGESDSKEWQEGKSEEEVQDECQQEETRIAKATNVDSESRETLQVKAESTPTDINGAETSPVKPMEIQESTIKEELAVEEETEVIAESGKEHTEIQEPGASENVEEGKSEGKEWETGKSGKVVQEVGQQEEAKHTDIQEPGASENVDKGKSESKEWEAEKTGKVVQEENQQEEAKHTEIQEPGASENVDKGKSESKEWEAEKTGKVVQEESQQEEAKHTEIQEPGASENVDKGKFESKEWEAEKTGKVVQEESQQEETKQATNVDNESTETLEGMEGSVSLVDGHVINQEFRDVSKGAAIKEAQCNDDDVNAGSHEKIDKAQIPRQEKQVVAEENSELLFNNAKELVMVEPIPVKIEEKVILGEEGKLMDQIQQDDSMTGIREAFDTNGREKKPMPDAALAVESEFESSDDETEEDEVQDELSAANPGFNTTSTSNSGLHLPARPAGLGSSAPLLEPASRAVQHSRPNGTSASRPSQLVEDQPTGDSDENNETREKLQMIRVKFLRLAHRLGQTPHNVVVAQVLYRLGLAEQLRGSRNSSRTGAFSFDRASAIAEQQEAAGQEGLDFTCTIMVLGKTGVGKSATINSIFDEVKSGTNAFQMGTKKVQEIVGTVQGIKIRVIDTPGLLASFADQRRNEKFLKSVKHFIKKTPPDIVLYFDRLDMQSRDYGDLPLLRTITETFGSAVWFNAIVVLTHAASAPPDGPNGTPLSYEMFVAQRSHVVQQAIRQAAGDMRLMNPVSLVENHSHCRTNRAGQRVLPNGQIWKPQLLLLCFASKILAEANALLKLQDSTPGKPFGSRPRVPPLPFLLSSLLQSRPQLKLPEEQLGDEDVSDEDLDEASDTEDESEYDKLPPFRRLRKSQLDKLSKAQRKAYFDELEYREKMFMKNQLKEERRRRRFMKKMPGATKEEAEEYDGDMEDENAGAASVPVPMPDMALPPSFDADNPTHRYRYLDTSYQWLVRPVLETHGWDHDVGYEGVNLEKMFVICNKIPVSISGQVTKDKKEANLQMECAGTLKHGEGKMTSAGLDIQTLGKELAYTVRTETRFSNFKHNKTTAGLAMTLLGDAITGGIKLEDRLMIGKRFKLVLNGGAITGRGDVTYGGSVEATLRDKDYPIGRSLSTLGLSIMDWHGDLAIGCNLQSQFAVGRNTTMIARANLNNRGAGQVSIRTSSSEQLQIALIGIIPIFRTLKIDFLGHLIICSR